MITITAGHVVILKIKGQYQNENCYVYDLPLAVDSSNSSLGGPYLPDDWIRSTASSTLFRNVSSDVNINSNCAGDSSNNIPVILGAND